MSSGFTSVAAEGKSEKSAPPSGEESSDQRKNETESLIKNIEELTKQNKDLNVS